MKSPWPIGNNYRNPRSHRGPTKNMVQMPSCGSVALAESSFHLRKQLRRNLVTGVAFHSPETPAAVVVLEQGPACFLKLPQSLLPSIDGVVLALRQRFACDIVLAGNFGRIEVRVVYPPRRLVDPARCNAREDDRGRREKVHNKVYRDKAVEAGCLCGCAGKPIENERGGRGY